MILQAAGELPRSSGRGSHESTSHARGVARGTPQDCECLRAYTAVARFYRTIVDDNGATSIDLWCTSVQAQATVGADGTITIVPGASAPAQCTPERESLDQDLIAALAGATGWRRNGDLIELSGSTTLRFRLMTN